MVVRRLRSQLLGVYDGGFEVGHGRGFCWVFVEELLVWKNKSQFLTFDEEDGGEITAVVLTYNYLGCTRWERENESVDRVSCAGVGG
jgi:hypothetical protein